MSLSISQLNFTLGPTMEQHQKKVAIVVPVYNMKEFLSECMDSILSQTYVNFDVFAVDDASTDSSLEILYRYQEKDSRVIVLKRENNGGLSAARNTALNEIERRQSYDYISFCDSDDVISPDMIEELVFASISEHADVAGCCFRRINFAQVSHERHANYCSFNSESFVEQIFSLGNWKKVHGSGGYSCLRLFNAETIRGLRFYKEKTLSEDEVFCMEVATKASKITYIPKALYLYRYRPNSLSRAKAFSRKLITSRINTLRFSEQISHYALILNACAIATKLKNNSDLLSKELARKLSPLLKEGYALSLISPKEYLRFRIYSLLASLKGR